MFENNELPRNACKYAVKPCHLPALGHWMHDYLPNESYDPHFQGQHLHTTYFDTEKFQLRKARVKADRYVTLRIRAYPTGTYYLQAKTDDEKVRVELAPDTAHAYLTGILPPGSLQSLLPAQVFARLLEMIDSDDELLPVVKIAYRRYAIEGSQERITLDTDVTTDTGKCLPFAVLEIKGDEPPDTPALFAAMELRPIRLSKFLWSTAP
jgi:hypothetical protein